MSRDTFQRFVQFAYTGDYTIPETDKRGAEPRLKQVETNAVTQPVASNSTNGVRERIGSPEPDDVVEVNGRHIPVTDNDRDALSEKLEDDSGNILNYPPISSKKHKKKKRRKPSTEEALPVVVQEGETELDPTDLAPPQLPAEDEAVTELHAEPETAPVSDEPKSAEQVSHILVKDFHTLSYPLLASRDNYEGTCEPSADFNKDHSYSNVLLSHASLYILGDAQLIDSLKALALFKLHKTLCVFELDNENIGDITDLARYAYAGGEKDISEGIDKLRELVCQYMAIHVVELSPDQRFLDLLAGGGQFVKDFFKYQLQRIH